MLSRTASLFRPQQALRAINNRFFATARTPKVKAVVEEAPAPKAAKVAKVAKEPKVKAVVVEEAPAPKVAKAAKATKAVKEPVEVVEKAPKAAKAPKEVVEKAPKAAKAPKEVAVEKAPKATKAAKAPKQVAETESEEFIEKVTKTVIKVPKVKVRAGVDAEPISEAATKYADRRDKFHMQMDTTRVKIEALVAKPKYSEETLERYQTRLTNLQAKYDRAHRLFKTAQSKAAKESRLAALPSPEALAKMTRPLRLKTLAEIDTGAKSGYQLFARELKSSTSEPIHFSEYLAGWKKLTAAQKEVYNEAVKAAKAAAV